MAGDTDLEKRERLFGALLRGLNNTQAAEAAGYSRKHVKELLRQPMFARELERRRVALPVEKAPDDKDEVLALETVRAIAKDPEQPGTARVAAAKALFDRVDRRHEAQKMKEPAQATGPPKKPQESASETAKRFGITLKA